MAAFNPRVCRECDCVIDDSTTSCDCKCHRKMAAKMRTGRTMTPALDEIEKVRTLIASEAEAQRREAECPSS